MKKLQYNFVFFNQFFFAPLCICWTCARQTVGGEIVARFIMGRAIFLPQVIGGFSCADDVVNLAVFKDFFKVVWNRIFYRGISGTCDFAGCENIPHCKVVAEKKASSFSYGGGDVGCVILVYKFFIKDFCYYTPKSILRMHIEESGFAAFGRRHGAENQYFAF